MTALLEGMGLSGDTRLPSWAEYPESPPPRAMGELGYTGDAHRDRAWLDFQHDVTVSDVDLAARENLVSVEHVKRYTTVGMSIEQGKTSNMNTLAVLAHQTHRTIPEVGTTTFRPPFVPVTLGAIAGGRNGRFYRPQRLLPAHRQHQALGAQFEDYGNWQRPACYPKSGETRQQAIERELHAIRSAVGLFDASPLGKILVRGPDAAEFLDRIYANTVRTLEPGKVRYGLMLDERGIIIDDGVCARVSAEEFWVNTTGAGAARITAWFDEWLQGEWPELRVVTTDLTSALATICIAGPTSTRGTGQPALRYRRLARRLSAYAPACRLALRSTVQDSSRQLHGRAQLRDQRRCRVRRFALGADLLGREGIRHRALRSRIPVGGAHREGLSACRRRHRWEHDS